MNIEFFQLKQQLMYPHSCNCGRFKPSTDFSEMEFVMHLLKGQNEYFDLLKYYLENV